MKSGDTVLIYQKPNKRLARLGLQRPEGEAELIQRPSFIDMPGHERWLVKFVADGTLAERWVSERDVIKRR